MLQQPALSGVGPDYNRAKPTDAHGIKISTQKTYEFHMFPFEFSFAECQELMFSCDKQNLR